MTTEAGCQGLAAGVGEPAPPLGHVHPVGLRRHCANMPRMKAGPPPQQLWPWPRRISAALALGVPLVTAPGSAAAAEPPAACPADPVRVVRSVGGTVDYLGSVSGIPELCRLRRTSDGEGEFYLGMWRSDWPGAGQAYPAIRAAIHGSVGTRTSFVTRSAPGLQWIDSYTNEGVETLMVGGTARPALRIAHERKGIEGNTYHSVITQWKDLATGAVLKTLERQISGRSYGPGTTWNATRIETLP